MSYTNTVKTHFEKRKEIFPMQAILESYRISCNQLTIRISELTEQMHSTKTQNEYDQLNSRKRLLQTERLELLQDMQTMMPYIREEMPIV